MQSANTPEAIKHAVAPVTAYASGPIQGAKVIENFTLKNWPDTQPADLAVVYVALNGESFSEAVTLPLAGYGKDLDSSA